MTATWSKPCWNLVSKATLGNLQAAGTNGRWQLAVRAGEEMLATGGPGLWGKDWYGVDYWLPDGYFSRAGTSKRYYRFGFDVGFTVGLTLLGVPDEPSRAELGWADEAAATMTWVPSEGAPHRFVGRDFAARFGALVCAFVAAVAVDEERAGEQTNPCATMPLHHGFVTAVVLADASRHTD